MSQLWSEINKVVNALNPADQSASTGTVVTTDVLNMENYKKCTFLIHMGAATDNVMAVTVNAYSANTTGGSAIDFRYRTQETTDTQSASSSGATFNTTTGSAGAMYIVEVDASTVAAEAAGYDHVYMVLTTSTGNVASRVYGVVAILSEPRYPQAILQTAID